MNKWCFSMLIETKFGKANINDRGYYHIVSHKEGNFQKKLHRLIYEDHYGVTLLSSTDIHHIDGNKTNNSIENLEAISHSQHSKMHMIGENNPLYGTKDSMDTLIKKSLKRNTSGYFRVSIFKDDKMSQGFYYGYQYYEDNKRKCITRVSLVELEKVVKERGLEWFKLDVGDDAS